MGIIIWHNTTCFVLLLLYIYIKHFNVSDVFDSIRSHQHVSAAITNVILTEIVIILNCYGVTGT